MRPGALSARSSRCGPVADRLDGVTVVLLTDTHYGPIDRARWSARVVDAVKAHPERGEHDDDMRLQQLARWHRRPASPIRDGPEDVEGQEQVDWTAM